MELLWWVALGLLFATYFALGGLDYGVGMLLPAMSGDDERRAALNALGPRFLGNEVWVVAAIGVLFGAFPLLEGALLSGAQPLVVALLLALMAVNAGVQLRSRAVGWGRRAFDVLITAASGVLAVGWGALLGTLLTGYPGATGGSGGFGHLLSIPALLCGLTTAALFARHGAAYLQANLPDGPARARAGRIAGRLTPVALAVTALTMVATAALGHVGQPVPAVIGGVVVLAATAPTRVAGRWMVVLTALAAALPVVVVGLAVYPLALPAPDGVAGLTVTAAAAGPDTLRILTWLTAPMVPLLIGFQVMCWRVFRIRADRPATVYW